MLKTYRAFEAVWRRMNKGKHLKESVWLKRSPDGIWGDPGYEQPLTHFDWMYFQAGVAWQKRQQK